MTSYLIRVLEDKILALRLLYASIQDGMEHTPGITHVQHHLLGQLCRLYLLEAQDLVQLGVDGMDTRDISKGAVEGEMLLEWVGCMIYRERVEELLGYRSCLMRVQQRGNITGVIHTHDMRGVPIYCISWSAHQRYNYREEKTLLIKTHTLTLTHPNLMKLDPARSAHMAHLAILQLLFFSSVANTAPPWESSFLRQSMPPDSCT